MDILIEYPKTYFFESLPACMVMYNEGDIVNILTKDDHRPHYRYYHNHRGLVWSQPSNQVGYVILVETMDPSGEMVILHLGADDIEKERGILRLPDAGVV